MTEVTQEDLETLKSELNEIIETRLDSFIDEFVATWNELENKESESEGCRSCESDNSDTENPARYLIFAGGNKFFATDIKPNAMIGIDFYLHEVDPVTGKEYNSQGTITNADVVVLDLQPEMDLETFSSIKRNTIDYAIKQAQEAQAKEKAMKAENSKIPPDVSHISYG